MGRGVLGTAMVAALACGAVGCGEPAQSPPPPQGTWPDSYHYPGIGQGKLVITNNFSDTLSFIDLVSFDMVGDLHIESGPVAMRAGFDPVDLEGPHHVAADPSSQYFYIGVSEAVEITGSGPHGAHGAGTVPGYVLKYRAADNQLVGYLNIDPNPGDVAVTHDGSKVLVTHFDLRKIRLAASAQLPAGDPGYDSRLAIVAPDQILPDGKGHGAMVTACPAPHGIAVSADDHYAYLSCISDELAIVDLTDPTYPVTRLPVGRSASDNPAATPTYAPYAASVSPKDGTVWISAQGSQEMRVYDPAKAAIDEARSVPLGASPFFASFTRDGSRLYVSAQGPDLVSVIDPAAAKVLGSIVFQQADKNICFRAHVAQVLPDESKLVLICEGDRPTANGTVVLLDSAALERSDKSAAILAIHSVGMYPDGVAVLKP